MIKSLRDVPTKEFVGEGSFNNLCTCGGYAWEMNGRDESQPHMSWCPQYAEYASWYKNFMRRVNEGDCEACKI